MRELIYILVAFFTLSLVACDRNTCENVTCNNSPNSICVNGECACTQGYEGEFCDVLSYEKYQGNYRVSQNCQSTTQGQVGQQYQAFIQWIGSQIDKVQISSFAGNYNVEAFINGDNMTIPSQTVFGSITIAGTGFFQNNLNRLTIDYSVTNGSDYRECTDIFQKF